MQLVKSFWKSILFAVIVLLLSTMNGHEVNEIPFMSIPHMDKIAHCGMYFVFTFILLYDFSRYKVKNISWRKIISISIVVAIAFGGTMELLQEISSLNRSTDIKDFIANSFGALCAVFSFKYVNNILNKISTVFIKPGNNYSL